MGSSTKIISKSLLLLTFIIFLLTVGCSSAQIVGMEVGTYADKFNDNLKEEVDACNRFISDYENIDLNSKDSIYAFQKTLPSYLKTFNAHLLFLKSALPDKANEELREAVNLAKNGTERIISGINAIDSAINKLSYFQLTAGETLINDGSNSLNQAVMKYNAFIEVQNTK